MDTMQGVKLRIAHRRFLEYLRFEKLAISTGDATYAALMHEIAVRWQAEIGRLQSAAH